MLKFLRKKGVAKKIIWAVAILIILSFGFLGTAYLIADINKTISNAGKIFGKKVSFQKWRDTYEEVRVASIMQYGDKFSQVQQYLDLDKETWNRLILKHEAKRQKIKITDEELVAEIERMPFFQRNGQFDTLLYNDILRYVFKIRPNHFEESMRSTLRIQKITDEITSNIDVSDDELFEQYNEKHEKTQVSYAFFSAKQYMDQAQFDESKAREFYEANKETFRLDDTISVDYVYLKYPAKPTPPPTEEAPETPEPEVDTGAVSIQADEIYEKLLANPNLKTIAKEYDLAVENTDYFSMNQPNLTVGWSFQLLTQLFEVEVGYIPAPIETPSGVYIIELVDKRPSHIPPFEDVVERVRHTVLREAADEIAAQKAEEHRTIILEKMAQTKIDDFSNVVKELGLEVYQTPTFIRGQYLPKVGISGEFTDAAFALTKENNVSDVVKTSAGYCILHLDEYIPADTEKFESEKDLFKAELLAKQKEEAFNEFLTKLRLESKIMDNIAKLREQQANIP